MDDFNEKLPESYLMLFDVNSLYAYAMSQPLPIGKYEWVRVTDQLMKQILCASSNSMYGYLLEVDLSYPSHLHDLHNNYPFLCEKMKSKDSKTEKLILNLNDKSNYVLHYQTLQMALSHGLILKKVHKILKFRQSKWLKPFIDFNTEKRKNAQNEFEKKLYKLFSNSTYGKTIENVRKRRNVKLLCKWEGRYGAKVYISKPSFKRIVIFNENLVAIELFKNEIALNRPIAVGVCVLEISKLKMYDFHYNFMLKEYSYDNCRIQYTDTDSFIYYLTGKDIYSVMRENATLFDTSDYSVDNIYKIKPQNKKIYGLMKDESNGNIMTEFIGLRAKMYCYKFQNGRVTKRAKGVKRAIVNKKLSFEKYYHCLFDNCSVVDKQATIKSHKHKLFSIELTKKMLDSRDDKRFILDDKVTTLAWGHRKIVDS